MEITRKCAWCEEHLAGPEQAEVVSHGICSPCSELMLIRWHREVDPEWVEELYYDEGGEA